MMSRRGNQQGLARLNRPNHRSSLSGRGNHRGGSLNLLRNALGRGRRRPMIDRARALGRVRSRASFIIGRRRGGSRRCRRQLLHGAGYLGRDLEIEPGGFEDVGRGRIHARGFGVLEGADLLLHVGVDLLERVDLLLVDRVLLAHERDVLGGLLEDLGARGLVAVHGGDGVAKTAEALLDVVATLPFQGIVMGAFVHELPEMANDMGVISYRVPEQLCAGTRVPTPYF